MAEYSGHSILIITLLLLLLIKSGSFHDECEESSCGPYEPLVRFPFQLLKGTHDPCAYPEFCLSCTEKKETTFMLPTTSGPIKFRVDYIGYESHRISLSDPENCLPMKFLKLNCSSCQPYRFYSYSESKIAFFNCSSVGHPHLRNSMQLSPESQDMISCPIYISNSYDSVLEYDLLSCTKMFDGYAPVTAVDLQVNELSLNWTKPDCTECEAKGKKCRWKNNGTKNGDIECYDCNGKRKTIHIPKSFIFSATGETETLLHTSN